MDASTLGSREHEFNDYAIEPLEIYEDPSGVLRGGVGSTIWDAAIVLAKYLERSPLLPTTPPSSTAKPFNVLELGAGTGIVGLAVARLMQSRKIPGRVVLTDKENVLPLLQKNIEKNPCPDVKVSAQELDWVQVSGIPATIEPAATESEEEATESAHNLAQTSAPPQNSKSAPVAADATLSPVAAHATNITSSSSSTSTSVSDLLNVEWDLVLLSDCIWISGLYPPLLGTLNKILSPDPKKTEQLVICFEKRKFNEEMEFFASLGKTFRFHDIKPEDQDPTWQSEDIFLFVCQRRTLSS
ncbi:hypothetical protein BGZ83_001753 [Gryganskiella cystojenkinii]|nr:hypothetical protein BGZ83_001753 [Gryganskiella cystojenkinii]